MVKVNLADQTFFKRQGLIAFSISARAKSFQARGAYTESDTALRLKKGLARETRVYRRRGKGRVGKVSRNSRISHNRETFPPGHFLI